MAEPDADAMGTWMDRALALAAGGRYGASPNPMVGAIVLDAAGRLAGKGFHARYGGPHAEIVALAEAGERARGGTLVVTLEPCAHQGKTPPCTDAILAAGVRRVLVAMRDPHQEAAGGIERLRAEGLDVTVGRDANGARRLNRRWLTFVEERRPWVTLKAAVSLDGRMATHAGQSRWITGEQARRRGLELREEHDAILVGVNTILADDPRLTRRLGLNPSDVWWRIVLDSRLHTPSGATVLAGAPKRTVIAHGPDAPPADRRRLEGAGARLLEVPSDPRGRVDLHRLLEELARLEIAALLVEGGAQVHGSFADAGLVDEVVFFVAPMLIGGPGPSAVAGDGVAELATAPRFRFEVVSRWGADVELHGVRPEESDVHGAD